jgi:hypothetical protein
MAVRDESDVLAVLMTEGRISSGIPNAALDLSSGMGTATGSSFLSAQETGGRSWFLLIFVKTGIWPLLSTLMIM